MSVLDLRNPNESETTPASMKGPVENKKRLYTKGSPYTLMIFKMLGIAVSLVIVVILYKNISPADLRGNLNMLEKPQIQSASEGDITSAETSTATEEELPDIFSSAENEITSDTSDTENTETSSSEPKKETSAQNLSTNYVTFRLEKPIIEAGNSLLLTSSVTKPGVTMVFNVSHGEENLEFRATTNSAGIGVVRVPGESFIEAGTYQISIKPSASILSKGIKPLLVSPGNASADASIIETEISSLPIGGTGTFMVKVYDKYQNPIPNESLKVLRSTNDTLSASTLLTNSLGEASFTLKKTTAQDVTIQVLDAKLGIMLEQITIAGVVPTSQTISTKNNFIANFLRVPEVSAQGTPSFFSFSGIQNQVEVNSPLSFTLTMMDSDNSIVSGYTGTVHFTSDDSGAELPNDYTFSSTDNGSKFFIGELSFSTPGNHSVTATDTANAALTGSVQVTVGGEAPDDNPGNANVTILSPLSGNTLNANTINIAGTADSGATVNIFDGVIQLGSTQAGPNGDFFFTTKALTDGQHKLRAESNGVKSEEVTIIVDTNSPEVDKIVVNPKTVPPGTNINVEVHSEPALARVKFIADGRQIDLVEDPTNPGVYKGSFRAPATAGLFKVDIELSDTLNNPALYEGVETFTVRLGDPTNPNPDDVIPTPGDLNDPIGNVPQTQETGPAEMVLAIFVLAGIGVFVRERLKTKGN